MKNLLYIILSSCIIYTAYAAETALEYLTAKSDGKVIIIEWRASAEKGIHHYEVERASGDQLYRHIATIDARGQMYSYRFVDEDALMKGDKQQIVGNVYSYRLRAIGYDNSSSVSNSVSVAHSISGIRRTWGMIKEMFR